MTWFAAYTHARKERWARANLWELGFDVYLPEYQRRRRHARRIDVVARPMFPRYLFVRQPPARAIPATHAATAKGVVDLVRIGRSYSTVPDQVIDEIRSLEGGDGFIHLGRSPLTPGQEIRIIAGSLRDHLGIFRCQDDAQRVIILVNLLGRQIRAKVAAADIAPEPA